MTSHSERRIRSISALAMLTCAACSFGHPRTDGAARELAASGRVSAPAPTASPAHPAARVQLPARANERVQLEDPETGMSVAFALVGGSDRPGTDVGGIRAFGGAGPHGSDVFMRRTAAGVEDFVAFDRPPSRAALRYSVDVSHVAGLRLVDDVLEFVDAGGAPRLRMNAPEMVDARGERERLRVALEDCEADRNPAGPWGRPVTAPGQAMCAVRVEWTESPKAKYPILVDPAWTATANTMTAARAGHTATVLSNGKVLIVGGQHPNGAATVYLNSAELFDPTTNTFATAASLTGPRAFHVAVRLSNGNVLVAGGVAAAGELATAELYDTTTQKFRSVGVLHDARQSAAGVDLGDGKVLVAGGLAANTVLDTAELYDATAESWAFTVGNLVSRRAGHFVTMLPAGQALVVGGESLVSGTLVPVESEYYDDTSNGFTSAPSLATGRHHFGAGVLAASHVLVAGGSTAGGTETASAELFDPNAGTWSSAGTLAHARSHHALAVLSNGAAVVAGGVATQAGAKTFLKSAELFDPSAKKWISLPDMQEARADHTATGLSDGRVLVAGGSTSSTAASATAEILSLDKNGASCTTGLTCQSKECVDGVCCESVCDSKCSACAKTATGLADGTCGSVLAGKDPRGSCKDDGSPACGQNGFCDGSGGCQKYSSTPCKPSACTTGADCTSGNCADGICCDTACSGTCEACTAAKKGAGSDGACGPVAPGTDPDAECGSMGTGTCKGDATCNGSGACAVPNSGKSCAVAKCSDAVTLSEAATCTATGDCTPTTKSCSPYACDGTSAACKTTCSADTDCAPGGKCVSGACHLKDNGQTCKADGECTSAHCVDGFCCDTACTAQCAACDVSGSEGQCSPATGPPHGNRPACNGTDPCTGTCNGRLADSCTYPHGNSCGSSAGCADGSVTAQKCNGFGDCADEPTEACAPFACGGAACRTSCKTDGDCAFGYVCDAKGGCVLPNGAGCADGGGKTCASTNNATAADDGGCGCRVVSRARNHPAHGGILSLLFGGAAWRRRSKRRMLRRSARSADERDSR